MNAELHAISVGHSLFAKFDNGTQATNAVTRRDA